MAKCLQFGQNTDSHKNCRFYYCRDIRRCYTETITVCFLEAYCWTENESVVLCFQAQINDTSVSHFVVTIGSNNFYLPYHIKIQSFNPKGRGPMSPIETIMSAEERK